MARTVESLIEGFRSDLIPSNSSTLADFEFPSPGAPTQRDSTWFSALKHTWFNLGHRWGIARFGFSEWERVQLAPSGKEDDKLVADALSNATDEMHDAVCHGGGGIYRLVENVLEWAEAQPVGPQRFMWCDAPQKVLAPSWRRPPAMPQPCATCGKSPFEGPCGCPRAAPRAGAPTRCHTCGAPTKLECARCHARRYCGKDCQLADWRAGHKWACGAPAAP